MAPYLMTNLEESIRALYLQLGISSVDRLNPETVASGLGIWLHYAPVSSRALDRSGLQTIILDSRLTKEEQWEEFGHELCHLLLHAGNQLRLSEDAIRFQEHKADNFAYHFCVPTFLLQEFHLPPQLSEAAAILASAFGVTASFARERLKRYYRRLLNAEFSQAVHAASHAEDRYCRANGGDFTIRTGKGRLLYCRERSVPGYPGEE